MADMLHITCSCGCDNRVPPDRRGQFVACVACGQELLLADALPMTSDSPSTPVFLPPRPAPKPVARSPFEDTPSISDRAVQFRHYTPAAREASVDEYCAQCGRELRGDWDRMETSAGILCYVCANQGGTGTPERLKRQAEADEQLRRPRERVNRADTVRFLQSPARRRLKSFVLKSIVLGITALFFVAVYVVQNFKIDAPFLNTEWVGGRSPDAIAVASLSLVPWLLFQGWRLLSTSIAVFVGVFMALTFTSAISRQQFWHNVRGAISLSLPFVAIKLFGIVILPVFGGDSARATLIMLLVAALQALTVLYIAFEFMDDSLWHCLYFLLFFVAFSFALPYADVLVFEHLRGAHVLS